LNIDAVVSPALGGIVLSQWVAYHLSEIQGKEVLGIYAEKTADKNMVFTRGYDQLVTGKNILVVEDVANTGGSAKKTVEAVKAIGGKVVAVEVMVNRSPELVNEQFFGVPFYSLAEFKLSAYGEADCLMCKNGVPINTNVGHGKKYLAEKGL
jgi:orotate phosphoribosyltransferase